MEEKDAPEVNNDEKGFNKKQSQNDNENGNEDNKYKITEAEEQKQNFYYLTTKEGKNDSVLNSAADKRRFSLGFKNIILLLFIGQFRFYKVINMLYVSY